MQAVSFTKVAPIEGRPFVTAPGGKDAIEREPRVRTPESEAKLSERYELTGQHWIIYFWFPLPEPALNE